MKLFERAVVGWRTSAVGITGSAVALYLFQALGCRWPSSAEWIVTILPAVIGLLTKEKSA